MMVSQPVSAMIISHMTTTTGGAPRGGSDGWRNTTRPNGPILRSICPPSPNNGPVASICGPRAPELAAGLFDDIDADPERFPFMSHASGPYRTGCRPGCFASPLPARSATRSMCRQVYGLWLWRTLMERGGPYGITPYGTEGMHLLRAEKGFIIVGQETDGNSDAGRSRHGLGGEEERGFHRQALAHPLRYGPRRPAATGRAPER